MLGSFLRKYMTTMGMGTRARKYAKTITFGLTELPKLTWRVKQAQDLLGLPDRILVMFVLKYLQNGGFVSKGPEFN